MTVAIAVGVTVGVASLAVFMLVGLTLGFRYLFRELKCKFVFSRLTNLFIMSSYCVYRL